MKDVALSRRPPYDGLAGGERRAWRDLRRNDIAGCPRHKLLTPMGNVNVNDGGVLYSAGFHGKARIRTFEAFAMDLQSRYGRPVTSQKA